MEKPTLQEVLEALDEYNKVCLEGDNIGAKVCLFSDGSGDIRHNDKHLVSFQNTNTAHYWLLREVANYERNVQNSNKQMERKDSN